MIITGVGNIRARGKGKDPSVMFTFTPVLDEFTYADSVYVPGMTYTVTHDNKELADAASVLAGLGMVSIED